MNRRALSLSVASAVLAIPVLLGCSIETTPEDDQAGGSGGVAANGGSGGGSLAGTGGATAGGGGSGGSVTAGTGGATAGSGTGGTLTGGGPSGGSSGAGATSGAGTSGSSGSGAAGSGGDAATGGAGAGGASGGTGGMAGSGIAGSFVGGGAAGAPAVPALDCGPMGTAVENHGPPQNRAGYVIVGDGYSEADLAPGGALDDHLEAAMNKRFGDLIGQPFLRYRKFVNICVLRIPSSPICGSSEFGCCGNDSSRLASCDNGAINAAISEYIPDTFEVDWRATVLNGDSWWNSGGTLMYWSGGNQDAGGAALHEGGHGFHALSDEYDACESGRVSREASYGVNVSLSATNSNGKFEEWIGFDDSPGTGVQSFIACSGGQTWRPSQNSMMNSLFGTNPNTSYNPVSREKIIMDIWRLVESPYDSVDPPAGAVMNPTALTVNVIDPLVINVDWSVDGAPVAANGGPTYNIGAAGLSPGTHTVTARAYDNADEDMVRQVPGTEFNRQYWGSGTNGHSDKTVTWNVTIQ